MGFPKVPLCPSLPPALVPLKGCTALRGSATPPDLLSPGTSLRSHQPHRLCLSCSSSQLTSSLLCFSPFQLFCLFSQSNKIRKKSRWIHAKLCWHITESMKDNKTDDFLKQKHYYSHNNTYQGKICSLKSGINFNIKSHQLKVVPINQNNSLADSSQSLFFKW